MFSSSLPSSTSFSQWSSARELPTASPSSPMVCLWIGALWHGGLWLSGLVAWWLVVCDMVACGIMAWWLGGLWYGGLWHDGLWLVVCGMMAFSLWHGGLVAVWWISNDRRCRSCCCC